MDGLVQKLDGAERAAVIAGIILISEGSKPSLIFHYGQQFVNFFHFI